MRRAGDAERRQDYDVAVVEYTKAVRLRPNDTNARLALDRAKLRASQAHFTQGRRFVSLARLDQALAEYEVASELNPSNGEIDDELRSTRSKLRTRVAVAREGKTELESLVERTRDLPPPGLDLPAGVKMPASLIFRDANSREVFTAIARLANISLIFDTAFRDQIQAFIESAPLPQRVARGLAQHRGRRDAQLLSRHGAAHGRRDTGYAGQAP